MAKKQAPRRRKPESDITDDVSQSLKHNFLCSDIKLKRQFPTTKNQTDFYFKSQNPKTNIVFLDGPAGSCKTYLATYSALELLKDRHVDQIVYIRSVVESSSRSIGALPGEINEKFGPYSTPLIEKLGEIVDKFTYQHLIDNEYVKAIPVNFTRGLTFSKTAVIIDEAQNMSDHELITLLTRFGRNSKYFVLGDTKQSDIKCSGFKDIYDKFNNELSVKHDIHCVKFDYTDIMRSPILKYITHVLEV